MTNHHQTTNQSSQQLSQLQSIITNPTNSTHSKETIHNLIISLGSSNPSIKFKANNALAILLLNHPSQPSTRFLSDSISDLLDSTHLLECCVGLRSLTSILQLSPSLGLELVSKNHVIGRLDDLIELSTTIKSIKPNTLSSSSQSEEAEAKEEFNVHFEIVKFLGLAINQKSIRDSIRTDWSNGYQFLAALSLAKTNLYGSCTRLGACLALIKLQIAALEKVNERSLGDEGVPRIGKLVRILIDGLGLEDEKHCLGFVVEGLALVSGKGFVRKLLVSCQDLMLKRFYEAVCEDKTQDETHQQTKVDTSLAYGIATVLKHWLAFREIKSEEDQVTERLRRLAMEQSGAKAQKIEEIDEDEEVVVKDDEVYQWIHELLYKKDHLLMELCGCLSRSESKEVRRLTGHTLLNLIEKQDFRGKVLQDGGARMVLKIIATLTISTSASASALNPKPSNAQLDRNDLYILQALAKLLITTNPLLVFGPLPDSPLLVSTLKPLTTLLLHPDSSLLQIFEAMMALTNLSSLDPHLAERIASTKGVLEKVEECLMGIRTGENGMVRRAATELVCNLASTEIVLQSFMEEGHGDGDEKLSVKGRSRLHLLIALSYCEDLQTSLAASASLAILTEHSRSIRIGLMKDSKLMESLERVMGEVLKDDGQLGLQFRVLSLLGNLGMEECGLMENLLKDLKEIVVELYGRLKDGDGDEDGMKKEMKKLIENVLKLDSK